MKPITVVKMKEYCLRLGIDHDEYMVPAHRGEEAPLAAWRRLQAKAKLSYHALMTDHHPDKGGDPELCKLLSEAYNAIKHCAPMGARSAPRAPAPSPFTDMSTSETTSGFTPTGAGWTIRVTFS